MRILHVTTVHKPLDSRIYYKEVRSLAAAGYDVALATTVSHDETTDGIRFLALGAGGGARWRRLPRDIRALALMLRESRDSIIHIHDPELLAAAYVPALLGRALIFDVHEFYRERLAASHWIPSIMRGVVARAYDRLERTALSHFAGVVIAAEGMRERYRRVQPDERVALVRNYPHISPEESARARSSEHPLEGHPYIIHTGGSSRLRAFDVIVEAAEVLRARGCDWPIVNIGLVDMTGYDAPTQSDLLHRAQAADVRSLGVLDQFEAWRYVAHASIGYLPLTRTFNYAQALPIKLFEYAFFGLPIVASDLGKTADIVRATGTGILVSPEDGDANGAALATLADDSAMRSAYAASAIAVAPNFTFAREFERLRTLYADVSTQGARAR